MPEKRDRFDVVAGEIQRAVSELNAGDEDERRAIALRLQATLPLLASAAENHRFLASVLDGMRDCVIVTDLHGRILYWGDGATALFGYSAGEMLGKSVSILYPEPDDELLAEELLRILGGEDRRSDWQGRRKDGSPVWVDAWTSVVRDRDGATRGFVGVAKEVTDRIQAQQTLIRQRDRLASFNELNRAVLAARSPSEVARIGIDWLGRIFACPRRAVVLLGDDGTGTLLAIVSEAPTAVREGTAVSAGDLEEMLPCLRRGEPHVVADLGRLAQRSPNLRQLHDEGLRSFTLVPLQADGELVGYLSLWFDHTGPIPEDDLAVALEISGPLAIAIRHADLNERLRRQAEALERRVLERTADLEAANRDLEAFNESVSRDLRSPLRVVSGFTRALLEDHRHTLDAGALDYLERMRASVSRMNTLIDDLLGLARVRRAEVLPQRLDLSHLARSIGGEIRQRCPERQVEFAVAENLVVTGDRRLLQLALRNLLDNAWKFTVCRERAAVEVGSLHENGERVFFVRDNGIGFDMAHAERIFLPFKRLHPAEQYEGHGIGLATVQRVVRRHGGQVWAESIPDEGATFLFTLPSAPG